MYWLLRRYKSIEMLTIEQGLKPVVSKSLHMGTLSSESQVSEDNNNKDNDLLEKDGGTMNSIQKD